MSSDPAIIITVMALIAGAGVSLMYAAQTVVRIAGALISSAMVLLLFGWLGLANFWLLLLAIIVFGSARFRPLFRRSGTVA
jgi:hypothetical protein